MSSDGETISQLMKVYWNGIWKFIYTTTKNREVTNDLTQEVFIQAYQSLDQFRRESSVKTWLFRIARNKCTDYLRSWAFRKVTPFSMIPHLESPSVEEIAIKSMELTAAIDALMTLTVKFREVVVLHIQEDLTFREIGEIVGASTGTVKMRYRRAIEALRAELEKEMFTGGY